MKDDAIIVSQEALAVPEIPKAWSYEASVKRIGGLIYKWKNMTAEIAAELYIAREVLSAQGARTDIGTDVPRLTWDSYCEKVGMEKRTANRWLAKFFPGPELPATETPPLPPGKYRVIYADPPWKYGTPQHTTEAQETVLETHYQTMDIGAIQAVPIPDMAIDDAVLFLWATSPLLFQAKTVIDAWGFDYKASFIWDKVKHNVGYYNSVRHEFLLICTRGSCLPDSKKLHDSVVSIERTEHSRKPPYFRELIDTMYVPAKGRNDRIELFARGELPMHWDAWGSEAR